MTLVVFNTEIANTQQPKAHNREGEFVCERGSSVIEMDDQKKTKHLLEVEAVQHHLNPIIEQASVEHVEVLHAV